MDKDKLNTFNDPDATPGIITKTASISPLEVTEEDLAKINKYTLKPVSADDVYTFKATIADNEQDDRNYMPFNAKALKDLKVLYPGKTMLKDHSRRADNQIARVYDTDIVESNKTTDLGETHTELTAKMYMIRTDSNKDLISEINGGIKKEVSTSTAPEKMVCNICGTDNMSKYCRHWPGIEYTIEDGSPKGTKRRCKMLLDGAKEAYELSFVAVPAQPRAGTHKSVGFFKPMEKPEVDTKSTGLEKNNDDMDARLFAQRVKSTESFFNAHNEREDN